MISGMNGIRSHDDEFGYWWTEVLLTRIRCIFDSKDCKMADGLLYSHNSYIIRMVLYSSSLFSRMSCVLRPSSQHIVFAFRLSSWKASL